MIIKSQRQSENHFSMLQVYKITSKRMLSDNRFLYQVLPTDIMSNKSRLPHTINEMFEESKNRLSLERESMIQNIKDEFDMPRTETLIQSMTDCERLPTRRK